MSAKIQFETRGSINCSSLATYLANDSSLEVKLNYNQTYGTLANQINRDHGIMDKVAMLIFGDLTITFRGDGLILQMLDSYTNNKKWMIRNVVVPASPINALCSLSVSSDEERIRGNFEPVYFFDDVKKLLMISLSEGESKVFYRVAPNLIIGMAGEKIASILVEDITIKVGG